METIISYIDNLFRNYPDTPQTRRAREELLGIMEDKYNELKAEGRSEHEAIGVVISEFGSMDEIASELGLDQKIILEEKEPADGRSEMAVNLSQAREYLARKTRFGQRIAAGVALCILSPVGACVTESFMEFGIFSKAFSEAVGGASLFLMIAAAVGIFITQGIADGREEDYKKYRIRLDFQAREAIAAQYETFMRGFGSKIAVGVILCILSVIPPIFFDAVLSDRLEGISQLAGIGLFVFVALGVALFITQGVEKDAYDALLGKGDFAPKKPIERKGEKLTEAVSAIYWPLVAAIYLTWSFISGRWGFTWIIWPVAGIIFGAISAAISVICRAD